MFKSSYKFSATLLAMAIAAASSNSTGSEALVVQIDCTTDTTAFGQHWDDNKNENRISYLIAGDCDASRIYKVHPETTRIISGNGHAVSSVGSIKVVSKGYLTLHNLALRVDTKNIEHGALVANNGHLHLNNVAVHVSSQTTPIAALEGGHFTAHKLTVVSPKSNAKGVIVGSGSTASVYGSYMPSLHIDNGGEVQLREQSAIGMMHVGEGMATVIQGSMVTKRISVADGGMVNFHDNDGLSRQASQSIAKSAKIMRW